MRVLILDELEAESTLFPHEQGIGQLFNPCFQNLLEAVVTDPGPVLQQTAELLR